MGWESYLVPFTGGFIGAIAAVAVSPSTTDRIVARLICGCVMSLGFTHLICNFLFGENHPSEQCLSVAVATGFTAHFAAQIIDIVLSGLVAEVRVKGVVALIEAFRFWKKIKKDNDNGD